eukprot:scaffold3045_cov179-Ochromonas_danica.AAC.11
MARAEAEGLTTSDCLWLRVSLERRSRVRQSGKRLSRLCADRRPYSTRDLCRGHLVLGAELSPRSSVPSCQELEVVGWQASSERRSADLYSKPCQLHGSFPRTG